MPKVTKIHFATVDGDKLTVDDSGNLLFHDYEVDGRLVIQRDEISEFLEWLKEEYEKG